VNRAHAALNQKKKAALAAVNAIVKALAFAKRSSVSGLKIGDGLLQNIVHIN